jgi:hypothetical protein
MKSRRILGNPFILAELLISFFALMGFAQAVRADSLGFSQLIFPVPHSLRPMESVTPERSWGRTERPQGI